MKFNQNNEESTASIPRQVWSESVRQFVSYGKTPTDMTKLCSSSKRTNKIISPLCQSTKVHFASSSMKCVVVVEGRIVSEIPWFI